MSPSRPLPHHVEHFDLLEEDKGPVEEPWVEEGDPLPEGWEDWTEMEGELNEDLEDLDWSELETSLPAAVVGYRGRATLPELGGLQIDAFCDTGKPYSRLFAPLELLDAVEFQEVEGERALMLQVVMAGREARALIRLEEQSEGPVLVLGRDVLRLGWIVDVSQVPGGTPGANSST